MEIEGERKREERGKETEEERGRVCVRKKAILLENENRSESII